MAITVTTLGSNSVQITPSGLTNTFSDLTNSVKAAILGTTPTITTGWTLIEEVTSGIIFTQVFQAVNKDAATYKNIILRWNTMQQEINITTCESWSTSTHTPTNEAWTFYDCAPINYNLTACDLIIFVHPRWCAIHSYINGLSAMWAGVFEFAREDILDTPANNYPCWGWIGSTLWMLGSINHLGTPLCPVGGTQTGFRNQGFHTLICPPRNKKGETGVNATYSYSADYGVTQYPNFMNYNIGYAPSPSMTPAFPYYLGQPQAKFSKSGWDSTKWLLMPIKPIKDYYSAAPLNYGSIYGLKMAPNMGPNMNKVAATVDTDGNYSTTGTSNDHFLLNIHHKATSYDPAGDFTGNRSFMKVDIDLLTSGFSWQFMTSIGSHWYLTSWQNQKVCKVSANPSGGTYISTDLTATVMNAIGSTQRPYDLKYDGERYVYICVRTGLIRLDTRNDTVTYLPLTGGTNYLAITPTHIVCSMTDTSTTPTIYRVLRSTFALDVNTGTIACPATNFGSVATNFCDMCVDTEGNVWTINQHISAGTQKVVKIVPSGGTTFINVALTTGAGSHCYSSLVLLDPKTLLLYQRGSTPTETLEAFNPTTTNTAFSSCTLSNVITSPTTSNAVTSNVGISSNNWTGFKGYIPKISGLLVLAGRPYSTTYPRRISLGQPTTSFNTRMWVASGDFGGSYGTALTTNGFQSQHNVSNWDGTVFGNMSWGSFVFYDGAKLITSNGDYGIRVITNLNGSYTSYSGISLGQAAIPS